MARPLSFCRLDATGWVRTSVRPRKNLPAVKNPQGSHSAGEGPIPPMRHGAASLAVAAADCQKSPRFPLRRRRSDPTHAPWARLAGRRSSQMGHFTSHLHTTTSQPQTGPCANTMFTPRDLALQLSALCATPFVYFWVAQKT